MQGITVYYNVKGSGSLVSVSNCTLFQHGRYQIGPFIKVFHEGEHWVGRRVVMSLFLNKKLLAHIQKHGNKVYEKYKDNWK